MKVLILIFVALLSSTGKIDIQPRQIENADLIMILNDGEMQNLNEQPTNFEKHLSLKMYSVGINKSMYETEMISSFHYYLAVSEFGEWPDQTVYYLGEIGEITNIKWLEEKNFDTAKLKLTISNYPSWVLKVDPNLNPKSKEVILSISVDKIKVM